MTDDNGSHGFSMGFCINSMWHAMMEYEHLT